MPAAYVNAILTNWYSSPRVFTEVSTLYGPQMTEALAGGIVYEYTQGENNYGLVTVNADGSVNLMADFDTLQGQFAKLSSIAAPTAQNRSIVPPTCSPVLISSDGFVNNFTIPTIPVGTQDLIDNGVSAGSKGQIIPITSTQVSQIVVGTNGQPIQGLEITLVASSTPTSQVCTIF